MQVKLNQPFYLMGGSSLRTRDHQIRPFLEGSWPPGTLRARRHQTERQTAQLPTPSILPRYSPQHRGHRGFTGTLRISSPYRSATSHYSTPTTKGRRKRTGFTDKSGLTGTVKPCRHSYRSERTAAPEVLAESHREGGICILFMRSPRREWLLYRIRAPISGRCGTPGSGHGPSNRNREYGLPPNRLASDHRERMQYLKRQFSSSGIEKCSYDRAPNTVETILGSQGDKGSGMRPALE